VDALLWTAITLLLAFSVGFLGFKAKIPAGAMVFAMAAVAAMNILSGRAFLPEFTRPVLQGLGGTMIGHAITKADLRTFRRLWGPALLLIAGMIVLNVGVALLVHLCSAIDIPTAFFACSPGGLSDMALIADELGANSGQVSVLQLFRLVGICLVYPVSFRFLGQKWPHLMPGGAGASSPGAAAAKPEAPKRDFGLWRFPLTLLCAAAAGFLLNLFSMPAAFMVGGVIGSCAFNLYTGGGALFPAALRPFTQAASGGLIGVRLTMASVLALPELIVPILLMFATMLVFTLCFGTLMRRISGSDLLTGFMAVTPGGVQEMSIIAQDLGCNTAQVVSMHTLRVIVVICLFPVMLRWLIGLFA
jgi:membrane AbrB-like protein